GGWALRVGDSGGRHHELHSGIHQDVERADNGNAPDQGNRNASFGAANFAGNLVQVIPAVISPQGRHQGRHETREAALGAGIAAGKIGPASGAIAESQAYDAQDDGDFQDRENQLEFARLLDSAVIQDRDEYG